MLDRFTKRKDAGFGLVDAIVGIGLASIIIGGPVLYFTSVNQNAAGNAATQGQNTAISEALDRTVASIQGADTILYAGPDELVTRSTDADANQPVITRWVVNGDTLYQQAWTGDSGVAAYDRSAKPSAAGGSANQVTRVSVDNLQPEKNPDGTDKALFSYNDKAGAGIDVTAPKLALTQSPRTNPNDQRTTYEIALVNIAIKAATIKDGVVASTTSAAPRSVSGKSDGTVAAAACPVVRVDSVGGKPVVSFNTLPGYLSYAVIRNTSQVAIVNAAASDAQKSWTDNSALAPGEQVNYKVQARNSDGSYAGLTCAPKAWVPPIAAPVFKDSTVLPSAEEAHEWTDGPDRALKLDNPRIKLQWTAVPGASSYDLKYRPLDPVTKTALGDYKAAAKAIPAGTTTFTTDEGGWGSMYEWFVIANATSTGSAESAHITTLTHPPAPQNVTITPEYGTGSARMTTGNNVIEWDAVPTAVAYDVWKYDSGTSGAVSLLGTVDSSTRKYTDPQPYGTEVTYYVAAINDGPRGTSSGKLSSANPEAGVKAAGTMPTVSHQDPDNGGQASTLTYAGIPAITFDRAATVTPVEPAPEKVTQLQFPPVPTIKPSRDFDGYNELNWNPSKSATGYQVARFDAGTAAKKCLTSYCAPANGTRDNYGGTTATTLKDGATTALPTGSKFNYAVQAYNPTGLSVELSLKKSLTQRPAAPVLTVVRAPDEKNNTTDFQIIQNADAGNTAGNKFCTPQTCLYDLDKTVTTPTTKTSNVAEKTHLESGKPYVFAQADSPEGHTTTFTARSKNEAVTNGGYSEASTVKVDTLPGAFWVAPAAGDVNWNQRYRVKLDKVNMEGPADSNNATTVRWGPSSGAGSISYTRRALSGDVVNASLGLSPSAAPSGTVPNGSQGAGDDTATPGAAYAYDVTATGVNGKTRKITSNPIITPAAISKTGTLQVTCAGRDDRVFTEQQIRPGGNYSAGAMSQPYAGQKISTKLIRSDPAGSWTFDAAPAFGKYKRTDYNGIVNDSSNRYYGTGSNYTMTGQWTSAKGDFASSDGYTYWMGLRNGFQVITQGADFWLPDANGNYSTYTGDTSYDLIAYVEVIGTFQYNNNCAPFNSTGPQMTEPNTPCYSFDGSAACNRRDYATRPHWLSR